MQPSKYFSLIEKMLQNWRLMCWAQTSSKWLETVKRVWIELRFLNTIETIVTRYTISSVNEFVCAMYRQIWKFSTVDEHKTIMHRWYYGMIYAWEIMEDKSMSFSFVNLHMNSLYQIPDFWVAGCLWRTFLHE